MISVSPAPAATSSMNSSPQQPSAQPQGCTDTLLSNLRRLWFALQVSHSGRYSIERLLALEEYTRTTSLARVLLVCLATPLPMAAIVFLQECVPLQDPADGWSANYGFWIRAGILGGVVAVGMASFAIYMIPGVKLSNVQLGLIFITQAVGYPIIAMPVAALWVFPIPFMVLSIINLYVFLYIALFRIIAGKQIFNLMTTHRDELILLVSFSGSQAVMAFSYAAYAVLFDHVTNTRMELPVILLLPVIKVIMKNFVSLTIIHMKDMVPEAIIFTVDFFNSLYLATCMQNTSSFTTVATMMAIDIGQTAVALRSLHARTDTILSRLHEACGINAESDSLLPVVGLLCRNTDKFMQQDRREIILHSCLPHRLSLGGRCLLDILKSLPGNGERSIPRFTTPHLAEIRKSFRSSIEKARSRSTSTSSWRFLCCCTARIEPGPIMIRPPGKPARTEATDSNAGALNQHRKILSETLEVLFTSECLLLTEYLESIIPILYGNFILLVVNLPSAPYHRDLVGVNRENVGGTVFHVYVYALLELASFVMLTLLMMRNCRMQALYHLAFVLETQMLLVQLKLIAWVLMSLSFRVVHFEISRAMIIPLPLIQTHSEPAILSTRSKFTSWCSWIPKVKSAWYAVQLSHRGGKYSIERMLALEEYTRKTSQLRVLLVCLGTPLPMIILVILQECIPLQDPKAGWSVNYGFWVRVSILGGFIAFGMLGQAERLIEGVAFSWRQYVQIFFSQAILYPAASILVAHLWAFPIPFMGISLNIMFVLLFVGGFRVIVGKSVVRKMLANKERLVRHVSFISAQLAMSIVYPVYQVVFNLALDSHFEIPVILLLPLLKLLMKNVLLRTITHVEDMMPEGIIFTVDFFNALYLVSSMQSASSIGTVLAIMIVDFAQTVVELRGLHQRTSTILLRLHQAVGDTKKSGDFLSAVVLLCSTKFEQQTRTSIRIRSCLPHQLSDSSRNLLDSLEGRPRSPSASDLHQKKLRATKSLDWNFVRRVTAAVHPDRMATLVLGVKQYNDDAIRAAAMARFARNSPELHSEILHEALELLFTSECIILTEYLESVIPLVYASFVVIMVHMPSAQYHTELDGVTTENVGSTVSSIFVYALLEFESFVVLAGMLRRNCGMRALYHLAFVLETQTMLIQTKFVVWMLMTLAFRVVHFGTFNLTGSLNICKHQFLTSRCCLRAGVDFTFQFAWIS